MKKAIIVLSLAVFTFAGLFFKVNAAENSSLPSSQPSAGQAAFPALSVSIGDWQLPKASYEAGEKIEGKFKLKNATNYYVSGIFYEIRVHQQILDPKTDPIFFLNDATLYDRLRVMDSISFSPQEEKQINFSYQISKYFPAGSNYYLQVAVFSSREDLLAGDKFFKIKIENPDRTE